MKNLLYVLVISLLFACKSDDPQADLLIGKWELTDLTPGIRGFIPDTARPLTVTFQANGSIEPGVFDGGYCNPAESYIYLFKNREIRFAFGDIRCLPFIAPHPGVGSARIIRLTEVSLILDWCDQRYTYKRI